MLSDQTKFVTYALGIFFCYFYYGIIQEKITRGRYGEEINEDGTIGVRFTYALALVWVQCLFNWLFAKGLLLSSNKTSKDDNTSNFYYGTCSLTYLLAMISSNMALQWVPYPTQVVGKSAKPIPVMILGVLIGRKKYSYIRYGCVFLIVTGVVLFMFKESKTINTNTTIQDKSIIGELLLIMSLSMDGLTGAIQDRMRASSSPTGQQMMSAMNWWSAMIIGIALLLTGEGTDFIRFAIKFPNVLGHLATLTLAGVFGQLFIFLMVSGFGPLACSVVTTTRKFFTVLCSVILFGNLLTERQWLGTILVFSGLFADMFFGKKSTATSTSTKKSINAKTDEEKRKIIS